MLEEKIIEKIGNTGPISFKDFMEMALYDPEEGYYIASPDCIGTDGDFYTSSNLTHLFGVLIGRQLEEMWFLLGEKEFTIVEYGAGTGLLCRDILAYLKKNSALYEGLKYCIIERSPVMRDKQKKHLSEKVYWLDSIDELIKFNGCILSNELVDNFSVHQVVMQEELTEILVDYNGGFREIETSACPELKNYFQELGVRLPKHFRTEVNLYATSWIKEIASCLNRGFVITIDYGHRSEELYSSSFRQGTLLCYHRHCIYDNPYKNIGYQDITTHVNFSALCHWGEKSGLSCIGLTTQAQFLLSLGLEEVLSGLLFSDPRKYIFLKQKLLLEMGTRFKVLVQKKNISVKALKGFAFT